MPAAIAYEYSGALDRARHYYAQAVQYYTALKMPERVAQTWYYVGIGCQRRQDWPGLQQAGEQLLPFAQRASDIHREIAARQFLVQAYANAGRPDALLPHLRLVVDAERRVGHPDLARDTALLRETEAYLQHRAAEDARTPDLALLRQAAAVLDTFARTHGGPDRTTTPVRKRFLGLGGRAPAATIHWEVSLEEMAEYRSDGAQADIACAVLDLCQTPATIVRVARHGDAYEICLMVELRIPGVPQSGLRKTNAVTIPATPEALRQTLDQWLQQRLLVTVDGRLCHRPA